MQAQEFKRYINQLLKPTEAMLNAGLVLLAVTVLAFCLVRINVEIDRLSAISPIVLVSVLMMFGFSSRMQSICQILGLCGLIGILIVFLPLTQQLFQSLADHGRANPVWVSVLSLLSMVSIAILIFRSWASKHGLLLKITGLVVLILGLAVPLERFCLANQPCKDSAHLILVKKITIKTGDPIADLRLNPSISPQALERETARLGLDRPLWRQYLLWLEEVILYGNFGLTQQGEDVTSAIAQPLRNTLLLNLCVLCCTWIISIPLGVLAASYSGRKIDRLILAISSASLTVPAFLLAIFALSFAIKFGWVDVGGLTSHNFDSLSFGGKLLDVAAHLALPVLILTFVSIGGLIRQMRGNFLDAMREDYVLAARARGISELRIAWNHIFRNAINPIVTLLGFEFASLFSGAALTEMILAYPGIGALTLEAAKRLDINLIMFNLLLGTVMLMLGNAFADRLMNLLDSRFQKANPNS